MIFLMQHLVTVNHSLKFSSLTISLHSFLESNILKTVITAKTIKKTIKKILLIVISLSININRAKNKNHKNLNILLKIKFIIIISYVIYVC